MEFTVDSFKVTRLDRGLISSDMQDAWEAIIKWENGDWVGVSRYHDEDYWVMDCAFRGNGYPIFSNGVGSRVTAYRALPADADETKALESRRLHPAYRRK